MSGGQFIAPGPGHSRADRSLSVEIDPAAPDRFRSNSFAGDDWRYCREYVRRALGLNAREPQQKRWMPRRAPRTPAPLADTDERIALVKRLWIEGHAALPLQTKREAIDAERL